MSETRIPVLQRTNAMAAMMDLTDDPEPKVVASKYFRNLSTSYCMEPVQLSSDWHSIKHDPVFADIPAEGAVISFELLHEYRERLRFNNSGWNNYQPEPRWKPYHVDNSIPCLVTTEQDKPEQQVRPANTVADDDGDGQSQAMSESESEEETRRLPDNTDHIKLEATSDHVSTMADISRHHNQEPVQQPTSVSNDNEARESEIAPPEFTRSSRSTRSSSWKSIDGFAGPAATPEQQNGRRSLRQNPKPSRKRQDLTEDSHSTPKAGGSFRKRQKRR
jgi:hypothetical protein